MIWWQTLLLLLLAPMLLWIAVRIAGAAWYKSKLNYQKELIHGTSTSQTNCSSTDGSE